MTPRPRRAFTLIELLVVIVIIALVSAATLPAVLPALQHRQISEAARLVQATIEGSRDLAIRFNSPRGVRLMVDPANPGSQADPTVPLAYDRLVPIEPAPDYSEGMVSIWTDAHPTTALYPKGGSAAYPPQALRIEESRRTAHKQPDGSIVWLPNARTNWWWNVRVGDRIRVGSAGRLYTVVGPMTVLPEAGNPEQFVNIGPPGTPNTWVRNPGGGAEDVEYLFLVNGQDDDGDGYTDEGWDGADNDGDGDRDELATATSPTEWEPEAWLGPEASGVSNQPYVIKRRPAPSQGARVVTLPSGVAIDATTWQTTRERSRLPVDPNTLTVDLMIAPSGQVIPTTVYSSPTSASVSPFLFLWIAERGDIHPAAKLDDKAPAGTPRLPMPEGVIAGATVGLKGERRIVTINARSGNVTTSEAETFNATDVNVPYYDAQAGIREAR